jgi:hypothetical protein
LKGFISVVVAVVTIVAVSGLWIAGSPAAERARRFDDRRTSALQSISAAIDHYWSINKALPKDLETLQATRDVYVESIVDPENGTRYEYTLTDSDSYSLCAEFSTVTTNAEPTNYNPSTAKFWQHDTGRTCYQIDVRKPTSTDVLK